VHKWETGKATPHPHNIRKLCELFGMLACDLDLGKWRPPNPARPERWKEEQKSEEDELVETYIKEFQHDLQMQLQCLTFQWHSYHQKPERFYLQAMIADVIERHDVMNASTHGANDPSRRAALR